MDYRTLFLNNFNKCKNLKKSIADLPFSAPPSFNKEVFQVQSHPSTLLLGRNLFIKFFFANAPAKVLLPLLANGDSAGSRLGPLQQPQTKSKLSQVIAPTRITSTLEAKDSPLSAHYQQNIPPRLQPLSLI